jgi:hypothetical protein
MGNGMLSGIPVGIYIKHFPVLPVTGNMPRNGSFIFLNISPNQGYVFSLNRMVKKLAGKMGGGFPGFG